MASVLQLSLEATLEKFLHFKGFSLYKQLSGSKKKKLVNQAS